MSGSDSAISQRITFSSRIVLIKTNPGAKLVFEKLSKYTIETSKLPFLCLLEKLGCQRQWIWKTFLIENFDIVSDFESGNLIRVKFNLNFAKIFSSWINSFTPHQISKTICFFLQTKFWRKLCFRKINFWSPFTTKNCQNWQFCVFFHKMNLRKKNWNGKQFLKPFFH